MYEVSVQHNRSTGITRERERFLGTHISVGPGLLLQGLCMQGGQLTKTYIVLVKLANGKFVLGALQGGMDRLNHYHTSYHHCLLMVEKWCHTPERRQAMAPSWAVHHL